MPSDDQSPITRTILREELTTFAQNLTGAFQTLENHIEATETRLLAEMHRVEQRLDGKIDSVEVRLAQRIETVGVSFRKLEADVASLIRRVEDLERFVQKPNA